MLAPQKTHKSFGLDIKVVFMSPLPLPEKPRNFIILWISEGACKGAVGFTG